MERSTTVKSSAVRSDSPVCRRIVLAFIDFIKSVEPAPGADLEGLDVARECLEEVFKLNHSFCDDDIKPGLLIDLFNSLKVNEECGAIKDNGSGEEHKISVSASTSKQIKDCNNVVNQDESRNVSGADLRDELFVNFYAALDKMNFFSKSAYEIEDPLRVAKATQLYHEAIKEMENSGVPIIDIVSLAGIFKSKGNLSMTSKFYSEAVDLYTCAIALCDNNAVYYSNRAAAYTQLEKYTEAIEDCLKSIEIDPGYSKAYSRLGLAYYNQGNYSEALDKGFLRALQLDPDSKSIKESVRAAQRMLVESSIPATNLNSGSGHRQDSTAGQEGSTSIPFVFDNSTPTELLSTIRNVVSAATQNLHGHGDNNGNHQEHKSTRTSSAEESATQGGTPNAGSPFPPFPFMNNITIPPEIANMVNGFSAGRTPPDAGSSPQNMEGRNEPDIRVEGNVNLSFSQAPEDVADAIREFARNFSSTYGQERNA